MMIGPRYRVMVLRVVFATLRAMLYAHMLRARIGDNGIAARMRREGDRGGCGGIRCG